MLIFQKYSKTLLTDKEIKKMNCETARTYLEITGIQKYLEMEGVTEIVINQPKEILIETSNGWEFFTEEGATLENLMFLTDTLTTYNNLPEISHTSPVRSVVLPAGERAQIIVPPACMDKHFSMTIRKPSMNRFTLSDYFQSGRFSNAKQAKKIDGFLSANQKEMVDLYESALANPEAYIDFIKAGVNNRCNFLIVGGTGSGKTTVAKAIADEFPLDRRIITVEDVHEMQLPLHKNKVHLFYKAGVIEPKYLIESAMRMKPDHIFLAELRGDEAWSYIEALNTGHEGSITTIHANNATASFSRLASIVKQSAVGLTLDYELVEKTIKSSIDIILFFNRTYLTEIYFNPSEKNEILKGM